MLSEAMILNEFRLQGNPTNFAILYPLLGIITELTSVINLHVIKYLNVTLQIYL